MTENHEKYISIEYNDWLYKYKPLEEENERLKSELKRANISIEISVQRYWSDGSGDRIGVLTLGASGGVNIDNISSVMRVIANTIEAERGATVFTKEEAEKYLDELRDVSREIIAIENSNYMRVRKIPTMFKWLFGIKKIKKH